MNEKRSCSSSVLSDDESDGSASYSPSVSDDKSNGESEYSISIRRLRSHKRPRLISYQDRIPSSPPADTVSEPASLIVKLSIPSAMLNELQENSMAFAQAPSASLMTPSVLTPTTVAPQTVHGSAMQHFTSTFRKNEDLEKENTILKAQLATAQEKSAGLARFQEQHEKDLAQVLTQCQETIGLRGEQIARVNQQNLEAKAIVQEVSQTMTETARQAQEIAQTMTDMAYEAQNMTLINNDDDDV